MSKINNELKNINNAIFSALKESDEVPYADDVNAESLSEEYMRRYKVSFYVDTDSMNNMDIEEKVEAILQNSGLASTDETIEVEQVSEMDEEVLTEAGNMQQIQNDWNLLINALNRIQTKTTEISKLKNVLFNYCTKYIQTIYNKNNGGNAGNMNIKMNSTVQVT